MFGLSHWFDILILLFIALLVFGPKRMIEMGTNFGKALRELRDATKEMNWTSLIHEDDAGTSNGKYTPPRPAASGSSPQPPDPATVVDSTIEQPPEHTS